MARLNVVLSPETPAREFWYYADCVARDIAKEEEASRKKNYR